MGDFGSVDWRLFEKFLLAHGCVFKRMKGDHRVYTKPGLKRPVIVPQYDPLPPFIILNNLRVVGVTKEEFLTYLGRG
jgi:predicted RNA binding protein YcfA (HicA-like mRNA interferase family)